MANINAAFPSNYLKAADIDGKEPVVTIDRIEYEPVGQDKEMKPILYFAGKDKGIVLNKTNATKIADLTGSYETDDWHGFRVRLFVANVEFQGKTVPAIRIKGAGVAPAKVAAPPPTPEPPPLTDDDIPF